MKKILLFILLLLPLFSRADHVAGIDLYYTHLSGNTYRVSMLVYGNCRGNGYEDLPTLNPQIDVIDSGVTKTIFRSMALKLEPGSVADASPYCPEFKDSTNCAKPTSIYQGYTRLVYSDTITLPRQSAKWVFRFNSSMKSGCSSRLGRPALNNYTIAGGANNNRAVLDAILNNTVYNNTSPTASISPIPAYCVNVPSIYDQKTIDPEGDSLVYEVVTPMYTLNCSSSPIAYLTAVAGYNPLHVVPGSYSFDATNGSLRFTADITQISAVDVKVSEYRNGRLVGSVMRERIFKVLGTCNNLPPVSGVDTTAITGVTYIGKDSMFTCPGNVISFKIPVTNPFGDSVNVQAENIISGSSVVINSNNTTTPSVSFNWNTIGVANGAYTFALRFFTKSCPFPSTALSKYTIIVGGAGEVQAQTISLTNCVSKAAVKYELSAGRPPYQLTVTQNGNPVASYTDTAHTIIDSLAPGNYHVKLMSVGLPCIQEIDFSVADSGVYPVAPTVVSPVDYCRGADGKILIAHSDSVATLKWYDPAGNEIQGPPTPPTNTGGTTYWYVANKYKTCESARDSIAVIVDQKECDYDLDVYNVITPNGDGKNDKWILKNINYYPDILVQVFNKLGDKVYERRGYQNDWDGGNLPSGMYYYLIRLNGINRTSGKDTYTGYLMIKR